MENNLQIFNSQEFGQVRTVVLDGEPWFVGRDVAEILGYKNPNEAIGEHVDAEDKFLRCDRGSEMLKLFSSLKEMQEKLGRQDNWFINESGVYSLIFSSKLPKAKAFKRWVTAEVLPAIRRHGVYGIDEMLADPETAIRALMAYKQEKERARELRQLMAVQTQQIAELQPKASYYDLVLQCKELVSISVIAKDYGWSAKRMNKYLSDKQVQYRQGGIWLLYQRYADKGYTSTKTWSTPDGLGECHNHVHTYWTQQGRLFIYGLMKADGYLPVVERGYAA